MRFACPFNFLILTIALLPAAEIPLAVRQGRPVVDGVYVNGGGPYRFLVDTGAESSQLDRRLAKEIGLRPSFQVELVAAAGVRRVGGAGDVRLRLGTAEATGEVLFTDMSTVREWAPDVQGVLGQSFLRRFDYRLDFRAGRMEFGGRERAGIRAELEQGLAIPVVFTSLGRLAVDTGTERLIVFGEARGRAMILRTATGVAAAGVARTKPLLIEGFTVRTPGAYSVSRPEGMSVDGLLPGSLFPSIYLCNSQGYIVFE